MKETENNEIDALLRNLARRGRGLSTALNTAPDTTNVVHLDADELSAYAERALPPSARGRCTAHLADCDDCRKIVVQLSLAAGPLPAEPRVVEAPIATPGWMQKLSALLSPKMVRYALPVLGLVIIGVAFFGLRQQQRQGAISEYVAVKQDHASTPAPNAARAGTDQPTFRNDGSVIERGRSQKEADSRAAASAAEATPVAADSSAGKKEEKKAGGESDSTREAPKVAKADADKTAKTEEKPADAGQPTTARAEPPPPASKAAPVTQEQQKDLARNNSIEDRGRDANVNAQRKGPARNENEVASQTQRGPAKGQAQTQSASKMKATEDDAAGARAGSNDEAETRTLFGRHFRRVGNAWVDTAFKSSMPFRSVTRGTDSYQALVADEPVIANIANRLSGEVIVVWKGHAYRIN